MSIKWDALLRRRGNTSLVEYAKGRGIETYEALCDSFKTHGIIPPTEEEATGFDSWVGGGGTSSPPKKAQAPQEPVVSYDEPVAGVLYEDTSKVSKPKKKAKGKKD